MGGAAEDHPESPEILNREDRLMERETTIPREQRAIGVEEVGELLGLAPRTLLEKVACRPDFPVRLTVRLATWVAGEILEWRDANRAGKPKGRRRGPRAAN